MVDHADKVGKDGATNRQQPYDAACSAGYDERSYRMSLIAVAILNAMQPLLVKHIHTFSTTTCSSTFMPNKVDKLAELQ